MAAMHCGYRVLTNKTWRPCTELAHLPLEDLWSGQPESFDVIVEGIAEQKQHGRTHCSSCFQMNILASSDLVHPIHGNMLTTPADLWHQTGKVVQDPIHGSVDLHDLLVKIIDTPSFQRLHYLLQTGLTFRVFPGAINTRFEHCIGVCYLSAMMLGALERNSPKEMAIVTPEEKLCVLIAGLCHDLGHGPFSHTWEVFNGLAGKQFEHEELSKKVFEHTLDDRDGELRKEFLKYNLGNEHIDLIQELICGRGRILPTNKKFLYEIVANKSTDIDVDKWDYFLRDGKALGIKVTFDYQRLLKFTKVQIEDGVYSIAFRDKEKFNIDDMFRMRADLHTRAYQHPVVKKIEAMLLDALLTADPVFQFEAEGQHCRLSEAHENVLVFLSLNDSVVHEIRKSSNALLKEAKGILERIDRRNLYDDLETYDVFYPESSNVSSPKPIPGKFWSELKKNTFKIFQVNIAPAQILITTGKFRDPISRVKFYSKDSATPRTAPRIRYDLPHSRVHIYSREDLTPEEKGNISDFILEKLREEGIDARKILF